MSVCYTSGYGLTSSYVPATSEWFTSHSEDVRYSSIFNKTWEYPNKLHRDMPLHRYMLNDRFRRPSYFEELRDQIQLRSDAVNLGDFAIPLDRPEDDLLLSNIRVFPEGPDGTSIGYTPTGDNWGKSATNWLQIMWGKIQEIVPATLIVEDHPLDYFGPFRMHWDLSPGVGDILGEYIGWESSRQAPWIASQGVFETLRPTSHISEFYEAVTILRRITERLNKMLGVGGWSAPDNFTIPIINYVGGEGYTKWHNGDYTYTTHLISADEQNPIRNLVRYHARLSARFPGFNPEPSDEAFSISGAPTSPCADRYKFANGISIDNPAIAVDNSYDSTIGFSGGHGETWGTAIIAADAQGQPAEPIPDYLWQNFTDDTHNLACNSMRQAVYTGFTRMGVDCERESFSNYPDNPWPPVFMEGSGPFWKGWKAIHNRQASYNIVEEVEGDHQCWVDLYGYPLSYYVVPVSITIGGYSQAYQELSTLRYGFDIDVDTGIDSGAGSFESGPEGNSFLGDAWSTWSVHDWDPDKAIWGVYVIGSGLFVKLSVGNGWMTGSSQDLNSRKWAGAKDTPSPSPFVDGHPAAANAKWAWRAYANVDWVGLQLTYDANGSAYFKKKLVFDMTSSKKNNIENFVIGLT